jgi:hypothetical protein
MGSPGKIGWERRKISPLAWFRIAVLVFIMIITLYYHHLIIKHQTFEGSPYICFHYCVSTTYEETKRVIHQIQTL